MTNFEKQLEKAIETYSEISGETKQVIFKKCQENENCQTAENIKLLMFAAR